MQEKKKKKIKKKKEMRWAQKHPCECMSKVVVVTHVVISSLLANLKQIQMLRFLREENVLYLHDSRFGNRTQELNRYTPRPIRV